MLAVLVWIFLCRLYVTTEVLSTEDLPRAQLDKSDNSAVHLGFLGQAI